MKLYFELRENGVTLFGVIQNIPEDTTLETVKERMEVGDRLILSEKEFETVDMEINWEMIDIDQDIEDILIINECLNKSLLLSTESQMIFESLKAMKEDSDLSISEDSETVKHLRKLMKEYIVKSNLKSLVLGISGGIDSALVAALAKPVCDELEIPLIGRSISIQTNKEEEEERARQIGNLYCTDFEEIDLTDQYLILRGFDDMEGKPEEGHSYNIRMGNIKARMRMMYLYNIASKFEGLVLSTDNMTELLLGFWTLHGDVGDYGLIQELWKTEVYDMTEWLANNEGNTETKNALMSTVTGNATDGLGISSTDLDQILPDWKNRHKDTRGGYGEVDVILIDYIQMVDKLIHMKKIGQDYLNVSDNILALNESPVIQRHLKSQFKRENPFNEKRADYIVY